MKIPSLRKSLFAAVFILSTLLMAFGRPAPAQAQEPVTFDSVLVELWPEYDQPSVLVMYHITLGSSVKLPVDVTIRIPKQAGQPHAVAMQNIDGLINLPYSTATQGDWLEVTFTTPVPEIRIEYYDPTITFDANQRSYTYRWPGDYAVSNLTMQVQQPAKATDLSILPNMGSGQIGQDGLTYYNMLAGQINAGTGFDLQLSYTNPDNSLTNADSFQPAQPVQPVDSNTTGRVTMNEVLPWALGSLGLLLIAAGAFWYWRTGQPATETQRSRHGSSRSMNIANPAPPAADAKDAIYCSQCGKRAGPGDMFCRTCGAKLR